MNKPGSMPNIDGAVDLGEVAKRAAEREKLEQQAREQAASEAMHRVAASWDAAMQRTFKGIMPRATRHAFLNRTAA